MRPLILGYHGLLDLSRDVDPHGLMIPPKRFRDQIRVVRRRGYAFVSLTEFARRVHAGGALDGLCAVTFDDGSMDNAEVLPALLEELGVPVTIFACPGLLGTCHGGLLPGSGVRLMNAQELREVAAHPLVEIGSHTRKHANLSRASAHEAYAEMAGSRRDLEDLLGAPVLSFAYPFCEYSPACPAAAERAGYLAAVTCGASRGGWRPYELRRQAILVGDGRVSFELKSRGAFETALRLPPVRMLAAWRRRRARTRLRRPKLAVRGRTPRPPKRRGSSET
jgi:peptidoglycan/xylan/chitin deacetylase (PgdA/CDA1 family)